MKRLPRAAENQQRLEHISHSLDGQLHIQHEFVSFRGRCGGVTKELGIRVDGRKLMAQIMGYGTGHSTDDGKAGRLDELLL
jgi:stringent starvation protein B